jgi:hypothetical protein
VKVKVRDREKVGRGEREAGALGWALGEAPPLGVPPPTPPPPPTPATPAGVAVLALAREGVREASAEEVPQAAEGEGVLSAGVWVGWWREGVGWGEGVEPSAGVAVRVPVAA